MNEQTDQCAICSQQPEDMLILSCAHNLCLPCATELYAASSHPSLLQCEICLAATPLDSDTVNCLAALAVPQSSPPPTPPPEAKVPKPPKAAKTMQCLQHGEEVLYFCFDCQNGSICSQCILESAHSGHSIMTLKRAARLLADKIGDHSRQLEEVRLKLKDNANNLTEFKASMVAEYQSRQNDLKSLFENIMGQAREKYNQLSAQLENQERRSIQIIEGTVNQLAKQIEQINKQIADNKEIMQKSQEQLLVKRYLQLQSNAESIISDLPQNVEHLAQPFTLTSETNCLAEIEESLRKVTWSRGNCLPMKENQIGHLNSIQLEGSFLARSPEMSYKSNPEESYKIHPPSVHIEIEDNSPKEDSMNRYSGIKGSSRRLQLSRSMNNATNIISRLQERLRK